MVWPARLVPPPRGSTAMPRSAHSRISCCDVVRAARVDDGGGLHLVDRGVVGVQETIRAAREHVALDALTECVRQRLALPLAQIARSGDGRVDPLLRGAGHGREPTPRTASRGVPGGVRARASTLLSMPQRLRVTYRKDGPARYVAHLDLMRTWERAIRRARLPLTYSQGFTPHPKLQLAAPLPVGTAASGELIDVWLDEPVAPQEVAARLTAVLPSGIGIVSVTTVDERTTSLQAASVAARYEVRYAPATVDEAALRTAVVTFLALDTLPWDEVRGEKSRRYDLRPAVLEVGVRSEDDAVILVLRLSLRDGGSARPSSVATALGLGGVEPLLTTRVALELADFEPAAPPGAALA